MINVNLTEEMIAELINGITERQNKLMATRTECLLKDDMDGVQMCREAIRVGDMAVAALVNAALGKK